MVMSEPALLGEIHFWIGCVALVAGFTAFAAPKGGGTHRVAGAVFTAVMGLLCLTGLWLSLAREIVFTIILSALAGHAVLTGWLAARSGSGLAAGLTRMSPLSSGLLTAGAVFGGHAAATAPGGELGGLPPGAFHVLAAAGVTLFAADLGYALTARPERRRRIARHLWRMGFAFFLATGIFFFGNNHVLPEALRTVWLLGAPVLAVVVCTVLYAVRLRLAAAPSLLKRSS